MSNFQTVTVSLPLKLVSAVKDYVKKEQLTQSELVRSALRNYLLEQELRRFQTYGASQALKRGLKPEDVERIVDEYRQK